jgi:transcriptional regulator
MYSPSQFEETRPQLLHRLMEQYPLATLVAATTDGVQANHIPLMFEPGVGPLGTLKGHIARANPLWRNLDSGAEVLAIFQGASHYISPNWYATKRESGEVVPTWNYTVVHARGRIAWQHDAAWLRAFLEVLTAHHERGHEAPWRMQDAPAKYLEHMLGAIVGFELVLDSLKGKWKLSQNRSAADRAGVVAALSAATDAASLDMAALVAHPERGRMG